MLSETSLTGLEARADHLVLRTRDAKTAREQELMVDGIVAGLGIEPTAELARAAGLVVGNGIVVDEYLRTPHPDVYAAGDVASFHDPAITYRIRVEHEDNANKMGYWAGRAMTGCAEPYHYLPFVCSTVFSVSHQDVGDVDARLETVEDREVPLRKGVVYYSEDVRVRGVLHLGSLWDSRSGPAADHPAGPSSAWRSQRRTAQSIVSRDVERAGRS